MEDQIPHMDPRLRQLLEEGDHEDEVAAVLRLSEPEAVPEEVQTITRFGPDIFTVRLRRRNISDVRDNPCVLSMKSAEAFAPEPELDSSGQPESTPEQSFGVADD